jgi:hypothetical protein
MRIKALKFTDRGAVGSDINEPATVPVAPEEGPEFCRTCELRDGLNRRTVHGRLLRKAGASRLPYKKVWHEVWACPRCGTVHYGSEILPGEPERFAGLVNLEEYGY